MTNSQLTHSLIALTFFAGLWNPTMASDELSKSATWNWPDVAIYEQQFLSFMEQRQADEELREKVAKSWGDNEIVQGPALLSRILRTAGVIEPRIAELNRNLLDPNQIPPRPTDIEWLSTDIPGWLQDTVRLASGRAFAQRRMYDEALETLTGLELVQVCDPSSLLFYRATCEHHLMKADECLTNISKLLEREDELETRFAQLANLMKADIQSLEEDSLDEISRLMRDVERRLDLGRAGTRVRDEEQKIIDKLDKLIDQAEQQLQQQQQQQNSQSQQQPDQQRQPMEDSQRGGDVKGPGDVDQKNLGERSDWGNLPPAERQESLQRLTEQLPSHYRSVIEGYFRQLAKERN